MCEAGKPTTSGKKPKRKGVTRKTTATVRKIISRAEESGLEWHNRCEQDSESPESSSHEDYYSSIDANTTSDPTGSSFCFVSNTNVHIGSIATGPTYKNPPPLIPAVAADSFQTPASHETTLPFPGGAQRNDVETPFWLTFIFGNVSRCNGCKGKIFRGEGEKLLPPPDDLVLGHKERVLYQNPHSGRFELSRDKRNVYYHPWRICVAPYFRDFRPQVHITIHENVRSKLLPAHKSFLKTEFGIY